MSFNGVKIRKKMDQIIIFQIKILGDANNKSTRRYRRRADA
jgi:hypothetical protein